MKRITEVKSFKIECYICDVCGREVKPNDYMEFQELTCIDFIGGYGSVFGDGTRVRLDMCQHCLKERLSDVLRIGEQDENEEG